MPLVESNTVPPSNNGMGLERFWTYQQFHLTDRLTLLVNLWNGNLVAQYSEFAIPSRGMPLSLNHTFNSRVNLTSTVGYNWTHDLNYQFVNSGASQFTLYDGDGTQLVFNNPSSGVYTSPSGNFDTLVQAGNTLTLTHKDHSKHVFALNAGSTWYPTSIQDRFGNAISLSYDGSNNLTGATAAGGQTLTFTPSGGALASVTDHASHSFNYQYDPVTGDLANIVDPLSLTTAFSYTNHLLTRITDPRNTQTLITFDANNRVQTITIAGKLVATFNYSSYFGASPRRLRPASSYNTFIDGNGNVTTYTFSDTGQVAQRQDALGGIVTYAYDVNYEATQVTDPMLRMTSSSYDSLGNLTAFTDTMTQTTAYVYNTTNDLLSVTDPMLRVTSYGYDALGNLQVITDAKGFTTTFGNNSYGQRTRVTDANTHTTRYGYNSAGYVITTTDALNNLTQYGYDAIGNRTVITDARGNVTTLAYDTSNRLLSTTIPLTGTETALTSYGYDRVGNRTAITDALGSLYGYSSQYAYDPLNRVISMTAPLTGSQTALTLYAYDAVGNRTVMTDANSHVTRYGYDPLNRTTVVTDALTKTIKYGYDGVSNRTVVTDAVGNATRYDYDRLNRVITTTNPLGKKLTVGYDAVGNVLTRTDELTQTTRYAYDALNRVISTTNPLTETTRYGYDKVGNTTFITSPTGVTTTLSYWDNNWLKTKTTPIGTTQYAFDDVGNVLTLTAPSNAMQNFVYDKANRSAQEQDRDPGGNLIVTYVNAFDANSNRLGETEKRAGKPDRVTSYSYNKANWLAINTDPGGGVTVYSYDAAGNRTGVSDALGITTVITPTVTNMPGSTSHYQSGAWQDATTNSFDARNFLTGTTSYILSGYGNFTTTMTNTINANNYLTYIRNGVQGKDGYDSYSVSYTDNNLVRPIPGTFDLMYDATNRVACYKTTNTEAAVFWGYYPDGNRRFYRSSYPWDRGCDTFNPGPANYAVREDYFYTGQELTRREWGPWNLYDSASVTAVSNYSYDGAGDLKQEVHVDYSTSTTTTTSYNWTWQAGAYRMTTFTATNGVTTTFGYDSSGRITRRYNSYGYSDYIYEDGTDWLLRETWHSNISPYNVFDLVRYWHVNGRPSRMEYVNTAPPDLSVAWSYNTFYLQYNWHGDAARYVGMDGVAGGSMVFSPWGDTANSGLARWHYYRWNGGWGYLRFDDLDLYYVHGRWYSVSIGRFISPDEKGEYLYGSGNDPINWDWIAEQAIALGKSGPAGRAIVLGGGGFVRDTAWANYQIFYPPAEWTYWDRLGNTTRGVAPIFLSEGVVTLGPAAAQAGAAYLGRTLLGRTITGGAAACAADQRDCANAINSASSLGTPQTLNFLENELLRVSHIMRPDHAWNRLVQLTGNPLQDYKTIQPIIRDVINTGYRVTELKDPILTRVGPEIEYIKQVNGQTVVVSVIQESSGVLRMINAWVVTK